MVYKAYFRQFNVDTLTPIVLFNRYVKDGRGFLLESKEYPKGRYSIIGREPSLTISAIGEKIVIENGEETIYKSGKVLDEIKAIMSEYEVINANELPFVGGFVGVVGYDVIKQYEKISSDKEDEFGVPEVHQMLVKESIIYDHFNQSIYIVVLEKQSESGEEVAVKRIEKIKQILNEKVDIANQQEEGEELDLTSNESKESFIEKVERAKRYIQAGDIFQVVLSRKWVTPTKQNPLTLFRKLRHINPSAYMYYINFGQYQVVGSSPEMLVEVKEDKIYTCPIAGTRRRGKNKGEDLRLEAELLEDEKELAEHVMLVDLARNDMGRVSKFDSVKLTSFGQVKNYSHVMHIVSTVEGEKREEEDMFSILASFIPAGTLSGAPKIRAMEIIEELESGKRGIYGGAVGYFGFNGNMDTCIAIRTMVIVQGKIIIQAGAGIVADSNPESEYQETYDKASALIKAIRGGGEGL